MSYSFSFGQAALIARGDGTLYWPEQNLLCVSDLHLGKAQRYAGFGGSALPPYDTLDTLLRLDTALEQTDARTVICLGDSFDTQRATVDLDRTARDWIIRLQAGRRWIWITGNHDPGPIDLGGTQSADFSCDGLVFRHIAEALPNAGAAPIREVSGHYHPKLRLATRGRRITRSCFALDQTRLIMPSFGTYSGGLDVAADPLRTLMARDCLYVMTGETAVPVPRTGLAH